MGQITHVEITAPDMERATAFYAQAVGRRIVGYQLADTGAGDGAIMPAVRW